MNQRIGFFRCHLFESVCLFFSHTSAAAAVHRRAVGIVLLGCHYFLPCRGANEACKWGNRIMKSFLNNMWTGSASCDWLQVTISGINYCLCCHLIAASQWMPPSCYIFPPRHPFAPCQNSSSTCHSVWVLCTAAHPSTSSSPSSSSSPSPPPCLPCCQFLTTLHSGLCSTCYSPNTSANNQSLWER